MTMISSLVCIGFILGAGCPTPDVLSSVINFRDIGGATLHNSAARVRCGLLFRSAAFDYTSQKELDKLLVWSGARTYYDVRRPDECKGQNIIPENVRWQRLPISTSTEVLRRPPAPGPADWSAFYYALFESNRPEWAQLIESMAFGELPAIFGCSLGKDRTGIAAALVLASLGVADEDIALDYALTSEGLAPYHHMFLGWGMSWGLSAAEAADTTLRARPAAILGFLDDLRNYYGSVDAALLSAGVSEAALDELRARLLSPH